MSLPRSVRKTPIASRGRVKAHVRRQVKVAQRERERYWKMTVTKGGCVMCRHAPVDAETRRVFAYALRRIEGHHLLPKSMLKRLGHDSHAVLFDERNGCGLCEYHHARHTNYRERVPRDLLPESVYDFAEEHRIGFMLDAEYPP